MIHDTTFAEKLLAAVGEQLAFERASACIVVLGGTAMNLLGYVERPTRDVDVLARVDQAGVLVPPEPLPDALRRAITTVANDFDQPADWMNTAVASQWLTGLPPGLETRIEWRDYGPLRVGLVGRLDLIAFKLYAAADQTSSRSVHATDLVALAPTDRDLHEAADWIRTQDASPDFHAVLAKVIEYVSNNRR